MQYFLLLRSPRTAREILGIVIGKYRTCQTSQTTGGKCCGFTVVIVKMWKYPLLPRGWAMITYDCCITVLTICTWQSSFALQMTLPKELSHIYLFALDKHMNNF